MKEGEIYIDRSLKYLYESTVMTEHLLPPIYFRREKKKLRVDQSSSNHLNESNYFLYKFIFIIMVVMNLLEF